MNKTSTELFKLISKKDINGIVKLINDGCDINLFDKVGGVNNFSAMNIIFYMRYRIIALHCITHAKVAKPN
jgi:hypothetical protein